LQQCSTLDGNLIFYYFSRLIAIVAITNAHIYAKKVASYAHTILRAYRCFLRVYRILRAYRCRILRAYEKITHLSCRRKNELMQMNTQCLSCCLVLSFSIYI